VSFYDSGFYPTPRIRPPHRWQDEPTDGLPRRDQYGVTWTPRDGVWWGDIGHGYEDYRQWHELSQRGPFEVVS
jgi:hypothetical protein